MEKIEGSYIMPEPTLGEKVDRLTSLVEGNAIQKQRSSKSFKMPFRGKIGNKKLKDGFATVIEIGENNVIDFKKEQIVDGTIKLRETFHAVDTEDILTYKGKPVLIIPKKSKYPYNPNLTDRNTTYSQKHIMSRMQNEVLGVAKKMGVMGMSIGALILGGVLIYALVAG